jgi:hypothetical protein
MTYKGKYRPKNKSKYKGDPTNVVYRSLWERNAFRWCDENSEVKYWSSEEVIIPYLYEVDRKIHRYYMDLKIVYKSGKTVLVEIKPAKETRPPTGDRRTKRYINEGLTYVKNQNKWKAAAEYAKNQGWEFQIWTENELRAMNILPKSTKPLKKLKPFSRKKTK